MLEFLDLADLLRLGRGDNCTVAFDGSETVDFSAFEREAAAWHCAFLAQPGADLGFYFQDSYVFAAALFGAWHARKNVVLMADALPASIANLQSGSMVEAFAGDIPGVVCVQPNAGAAIPDWQVLDRHAQQLVVYTSGSSGVPAAIPKRLSQLFDEVRALAQCFGDRFGGTSICATVSHQHIYGLLFAVLLPLACGLPFSRRRLVFVEDIAAELADNAAHILVASPAHLKRLPDGGLVPPLLPSGVRVVFSSGGPLPDDALPRCLACLGQVPIEVYGSSETGGVAWRQRSAGTEWLWQALPGVAIQLDGEGLQVSSAHTDAQGWQRMSDRVRMVGHGFELLGRSDRIVKIEEKRVSLNAVEQALLKSGLVTEVRVLVQAAQRTQLLVVAVPHAEGLSLLNQAKGKQLLNARLRASLESVLEPSVLPRRWRYVPSLPVNQQGKTTEASLLALFNPLRPSARILTRSANAVSLQVEVEGKSPYFDGHFADAPILPGVAQLDWVVLFGREFFELPPHFLGLETVKFQQVIKPGMSIEIDLQFDTVRGRLAFALRSTAGAHASGRFIFGTSP